MVPLSGRGGLSIVWKRGLSSDDGQHLDDVREVIHVGQGFCLDRLCIWKSLDRPFVWKGRLVQDEGLHLDDSGAVFHVGKGSV